MGGRSNTAPVGEGFESFQAHLGKRAHHPPGDWGQVGFCGQVGGWAGRLLQTREEGQKKRKVKSQAWCQSAPNLLARVSPPLPMNPILGFFARSYTFQFHWIIITNKSCQMTKVKYCVLFHSIVACFRVLFLQFCPFGIWVCTMWVGCAI